MTQTTKQELSEEEIEEILDMHAPNAQFSAAGLRDAIRQYPLLFGGLAFAFGILLGISVCSTRRKA